jgi:pimeloyl-ACP methyl ester carboxylesterase
MNEIVTHPMARAAIDGVELEYDLRGSAEPVVLIHWGLCATWAEPLTDEPALADRHRLLRYHRAGFGGSDGIEGSVGIAEHAAHCALLMRRLGLGRAHVVGHSSSALIALQLALDAPEAAGTLTLMEPARPVPPTDDQAAFVRDFVAPAIARHRDGDKAGAVDTFAGGVFGSGYRERLAPGVFEQAVADADAFFGQELPALQQWSFTEADAGRITQPVLAVRGEHTAATFPGRLDLLTSWLPDVESVEVPGATHLLHLERPREVAEILASFYARHPLS